jgi:hypothetical protein
MRRAAVSIPSNIAEEMVAAIRRKLSVRLAEGAWRRRTELPRLTCDPITDLAGLLAIFLLCAGDFISSFDMIFQLLHDLHAGKGFQ